MIANLLKYLFLRPAHKNQSQKQCDNNINNYTGVEDFS